MIKIPSEPRIALVHDHLIQHGGAERVLEILQNLWPNAPTFTLLYNQKELPFFKEKNIQTSFLQKFPFALQKYQWYLPLMPTATESYDLSSYDIIISGSSAFSKGVITGHRSMHVCYCHTPTRYLWSDTTSYVEELKQSRFVKWLLPPLLSYLRLWDKQAADRVDQFIANSKTVRDRIEKYYRRPSFVIHPPVEVEKFSITNHPKNYFLAGGRLVAYKRFDIIVEACTRLRLPLKIFGTGPMQKDLERLAGPTIEFLGRVSDKDRAKLYAECRAYLHPQEEDFGITVVEAMASGRPVIAYRKGGALETVIEGKTGLFFDHQNWENLAHILLGFDSNSYNPEIIRSHATNFRTERFKEQIKNFIEHAWEEMNQSSYANRN